MLCIGGAKLNHIWLDHRADKMVINTSLTATNVERGTVYGKYCSLGQEISSESLNLNFTLVHPWSTKTNES